MSGGRRTVLIALAATGFGLLVFVVVVAVLLRALGFFSSSGDRGYSVTIDDDHVAITLELPEPGGITRITSVPDDPQCPVVAYGFDSQFTIVAYGRSCRLDEGTNHQIGNGDHGTYRRLQDVPDPIGVGKVSTDIGMAQVFTQEYFECTNFCDDWQEPVAIVTLDDPVDPEFPTLLLRSDKGELDRDEFTDVVRSLEAPD